MKEKDRTVSLWQTVPPPRFSSLDKSLNREQTASDLTTDVLIIGAGLAGLSVANTLCERGAKVIVIDSSTVGGGQTSRTTAHLAWALENRMPELLRTHGPRKIAPVIHAHQWAISRIESLIKTMDEDCDFRRTEGYLFLSPKEKLSYLQKNLKAYHECGMQDVELVSHTPLINAEVPALKFPRHGRFFPTKYVNGLAKKIIGMGGLIYEDTHALDVHAHKNGVTVHVKNGPNLHAKSVVVATNTPINDRFVIHTKQSAYRTYAVGFEVNQMPENTDVLLWDTQEPYHYVRFEKDILIVGGEDHRTGQMPKSKDPFHELEKWSRASFPFIGERKFMWSGQILETMDGLPFIGRNPHDSPNVYIVTGEAGMGMTYSTIAGDLIPALIEGKSHPLEKILAPNRFKLNGLDDYLLENMNTAAQYADWMIPGEVSREEKIPIDCGAILSKGSEKWAVYRDLEGTCHRVCATCPHLYGIVQWNPKEKTWDCPCHGSRFDRFGRVLEGPAVGNLAQR